MKVEDEFDVRRMGIPRKYIGCELYFHDSHVQIAQQDIIMKMEKAYKNELEKQREMNVPTPQGVKIIRTKENEEKMSETQQQKYRSGVGTLLYLVKHSRPDICNAVRELSMVMDAGTQEHYKRMIQVMHYVQKTKQKVLTFKPKKEDDDTWRVNGFSDSDWAGDTDNRKSVTGWCIFVGECLVGWGSRAQRSVTLSSTEAEYVAVSEVCTEILFIAQIMRFVGMTVKYPLIVNVDNIGAIFVTENSVGRRTRHIDTRYHFVQEYVEEGVVKIIFVRTENNRADTNTKNTDATTYQRHTDVYMSNISNID